MSSKELEKMNNEPLALMRKTDITELVPYDMELGEDKIWIHLYDHPPLRELTDTEIGECMGLDLAMQGTAYMEIVNKVRACFKKAREK